MSDTKAQVSTPMDDTTAEVGQTESELLDAVLANSEFFQGEEYEESLPEAEVPELDPDEESEVEDPEDDSELDYDEDYEEDEEIEEDIGDDDEESSTEDGFIPLEDLDLDVKTEVTIDGEKVEVSLSDLVKGYSTEQSLSKKGRELGEARKQLEAEREQQLSELGGIAQVAATMVLGEEQGLQKQYHNLEAQIKEARENDDTYELTKLKDEQSQVQKQYWEVRNKREGMLQQVQQLQEQQAIQQWNNQINAFNEVITDYIPGFDQDIATNIRDFAMEEGLPEQVIDSVVDPRAIKMLYDYMQLKNGVSKGVAKRKAVATKKAPTRKAKYTNKKKAEQADRIKAKAFSEDATSDDQMAFLKQYATNSLNNL